MQKPPICRHIRVESAPDAMLAMQKVEGSNPFSRSRKGLHLQAFFVHAAGWCVCIAGHPMVTRVANTRRERLRELCLQAFPDDSNQ
jgi:hypothetical protein